jgi:ring-1,2-phenylacetyl-CoA epoxidase subunit PaaE
MSNKIEHLVIDEVKQLTDNAVAISFEIPNDLKKSFGTFYHGQYVTLLVTVNGKEYRRSYSISSSYLKNEGLQIGVKKVPNGIVSTFLNDHIKAGESLKVMPPLGNFILNRKPDTTEKLCLIAGGSGITPVISLAKEALLSTRLMVELFYGNKNVNEIMFLKEIEALKEEFPDRFSITHVLEEASEAPEIGKIEEGRFSIENTENLLGKQGVKIHDTAFYICGPTLMMQAVEQGLAKMNVPKNQICIEYFSSPEEDKKSAPEKTTDFTGKASVQVILDDETFNVEIDSKKNILTALLEAGIDAPFSCQGGVCSSCRTLVEEGEIYLKKNFGITESEIEQGYALACCSFPRSSNIKINFDEA